MKILLVNDFASGGGAEHHVQGVLDLLSEAGHNVRLLHGDKGLRQYIGRMWDPLLVRRVDHELRDFQPDVVHVHKHNLFWGAAPFVACLKRRIRLVCTQHDFSGVCPEGWMVCADGVECKRGFGGHCWGRRCLRSDRWTMDAYRKFNLVRLTLQRNALRRATACFLAPSNHLVEWIRIIYGPSVRAEVMPSSVVVPPLKLRNLDNERLEVFVASRLEREKGLDLLLRAMVGVPGVRLSVAGDGGQATDLHSLCDSLGIAQRVRWLGKMDAAGVREGCRKAHLVVQPSVWIEGGGDATLSILEGMAEGCAVASSGFGEVADVIDDGINGWIVQRGSVRDWERALREAAADPGRCLRMGANAHAKVLRERTPDALRQRLETVYRRDE